MAVKNRVEVAPKTSPHQMEAIALSLTFIGGLVDCFAYLNFDHSLPVSQTGNMILLVSDFSLGQWSAMGTKVTTLICFIIGLVASRYFHRYQRTIYWRFYSLIVLALSPLLAYFFQAKLGSAISLIPLAISLAFCTGAFNLIGEHSYNNSFTTGNIKKATMAWADYFFTHENKQKNLAYTYTKLVFSFFLGVVTSSLLQWLMGNQTLLVLAVFIVLVACYYLRLVLQFEASQIRE